MPPEPDYNKQLTELHNATVDALIAGLKTENADKFVKPAIDLFKYYEFQVDASSHRITPEAIRPNLPEIKLHGHLGTGTG